MDDLIEDGIKKKNDEDDEEGEEAGTGGSGGASIAGYEYQIDVSVPDRRRGSGHRP